MKAAPKTRKPDLEQLNQDTIRFLKRLKRNNTREWFDAHRKEYEQVVRAPSRRLVDELAPLLRVKFPHLEVSHRSIYRINRDTRFSDDKTPYKTWIGFLFRDRRFDKESAPALYLGLDHTGLALGAGIWRFESLQRAVFRERVVHEPTQSAFAHAIFQAKKSGFELLGKELKKVPAGYDIDHPHADFLMHNGFYASLELDMPKSFGTDLFAKELLKRFESIAPLLQWMSSNLRVTV